MRKKGKKHQKITSQLYENIYKKFVFGVLIEESNKSTYLAFRYIFNLNFVELKRLARNFKFKTVIFYLSIAVRALLGH